MNDFKMVAESTVREVNQGMNEFQSKNKKYDYCVKSLDMILSLLLNIMNTEIPFEIVVI